MSRYRSVRRAQQEQTQQPEQYQQQQSPPAVPPLPLMPAVPEMHSQNDAPVSRSMSRYHRRPTTSHATSPNPPPLRSNTIPYAPPPPPAQSPPSTSRNRALSSPYQSPYAANTGQHRPRTAKNRVEEFTPLADNAPRQQSLGRDDSARDILQKEKERQRQLREQYEADARAKRQARQAEMDRAELLRQEVEEAERLKAQQEAEDAEALRRHNEQLRAEQHRGKRLQKAESEKVHQQREDEIRQAKLEERARQATLAKLEEKSRKPPSASPPVSPPRRQEVGFGMFKRRKDDVLGIEAPVQQSSPPRLNLSLGDPEEDTIRPGGGGVVLGIDAPTSAVNAGDRVRNTQSVRVENANICNSV
jgi:hypothetical protein